MIHQKLKAAVATAAIVTALFAYTGVANARGGFGGFHGGGFRGGGMRMGGFGGGMRMGGFGGGMRMMGGGFRGGVLPAAGFRGGGWGYGGRRFGYRHYRGWGGAWPWYAGAGLVGGYGYDYDYGYGWPYYNNIDYYGYNGCYQPRPVWTAWGWRRRWVNACGYGGWGYGGWGW